MARALDYECTVGKLVQVSHETYVFLALSADKLNLHLRFGESSLKRDILAAEDMQPITDFALYRKEDIWELAVLTESILRFFIVGPAFDRVNPVTDTQLP